MTDRSDESSSWRLQWEIFHAALDRAPEERARYLAEACPSKQMRREVEELLASHEDNSGPLDQSLVIGSEALRESRLSEQVTLMRQDQLTLAPGTILVDRFEIVRILGQGGMGSVYEAQDRTLGTRVAIKMLRPDLSRASAANERLLREVQLARQVTHPHVCRLYDLFRDERGDSFLSMELLSGRTLSEFLGDEGALTPSRALPIVEQIASALAAAHKVGVIHRDLKSSNVMLEPDGDGIRAVVTDFGLATTASTGEGAEHQLTQTGELLGTPAFMAPEQLEGGEITPATDIYAFGIVIFEMLTGTLPFEGSTPFSIAAHRLHQEAPSPRLHLPDLDRQWERTILRCLERAPQDRFQSAEQIVSALESETVALPRSRRLRRYRTIAWTAAVVVAAGFVALAGPRLARLVAPTSEVGIVREATSTGISEAPAWVLVTNLDDRAGAEFGENEVEAALIRELTKSDRVGVVPKQRIERSLQLMKRSKDTRLDAEIGREVALRDGNTAAILGSRMERLGEGVAMTVELTRTDDDAPFATVIEEADQASDIPEAIRRLAKRTREIVDDPTIDLPVPEPLLARVTTASLEALELFSQADAARVARRSWVAEGLYRRALEEDPEFASGYTYLAYNLYYRGQPEEEYLPLAHRGVELVEGTTATERLFILGAYDEMSGDEEQARKAFGSLLRLQPDHYWALDRMKDLYQRSVSSNLMTRWWVEAAKVRPDSGEYNGLAAFYLVVFEGRIEDAEIFAERALENLTEAEIARTPEARLLPILPFHRAWVAGDLSTAVEELADLEVLAEQQRGERRNFYFWNLMAGYSYLGMIDRFDEIRLEVAMSRLEDESWHRRAKRDSQLMRLDDDQWRAVVTENPLPSLGKAEVAVLVRAGMMREARDLFETLEPPPAESKLAHAEHRGTEGLLELAEGRPGRAIELLQESLDVWRYAFLGHAFFGACEALARAYAVEGSVESAIAVLVDASQQRPRAIYGKESWLDMRFYLAELLREQGREAAATEVESDLGALLQHADPDTRWARRLASIGESPSS